MSPLKINVTVKGGKIPDPNSWHVRIKRASTGEIEDVRLELDKPVTLYKGDVIVGWIRPFECEVKDKQFSINVAS